jgi:hypothetical protein
VERVELAENCELRLISRIWYHVQLAPLPEAVYRIYREVQTRFCTGYSPRRGTYEVELDVRRLITPTVRDVVTGKLAAAGPEIDDAENRESYQRAHPTRFYAIAKRVLSRRELRRYGLCNPPPDER